MFCSWLLQISALVALGAFAGPLAAPPPLLPERDVSPALPVSASSLSGSSDCTSIYYVPSNFTLGPVSTVWTATATTTVSLDCGGCNILTKSLGYGRGHGPIAHYTTTTTAATPRMTTAYACLSS